MSYEEKQRLLFPKNPDIQYDLSVSSSVDKKRISLGGWLLYHIPPFSWYPRISFRATVFILTFLCYTCYHMNRRAFSGVKSVIGPNCTKNISSSYSCSKNDSNITNPGWGPFVGSECGTLLGMVDNSWGVAYAISMFISGFIAERVDLRHFLTIGMIGTSIGSVLFGISYYAQIHMLYYFIIIRIFSGAMQSTGWPSVVPIMGNWFGKKRRGLLMGIWNSHTSIGNIIGLYLAAQWANQDQWAWSFFVPAFIMFGTAIIIFLYLVVDPNHVGLPPPVHHLKSEVDSSSPLPEKKFVPAEGSEENTSVNSQPEEIDDKINKKSTSLLYKIFNSVKTFFIGNRRGAISIVGVLTIPGVIEYSLALFFSKFVAYTFLFWLPYYVKSLCFSDNPMTSKEADEISVLFDVGGILGSLFAGLFSDLINARAITCVLMLYLSIPSLFFYHSFGHTSYATFICLMIICGILINGPYACITTAVSSDLGTHRSLKGNQKAKATVSAIIDGTGSIGAAIGPFLIGWVVENVSYPWEVVFYILMGSCFLSSLFLSRLVFTEVKQYYLKFTTRKYVSDILE